MICRDARMAALLALSKAASEQIFIDNALHIVLEECSLEERDAALASHICFGVVQNKLYLDYILAHFASGNYKKLHPTVKDILRIGAYQIIFLDKIPPSAAVNTAVTLCKWTKKGFAAGLCNALLRKVVQNKDALPAVVAAREIDRLSIRYSVPIELAERFHTLLGDQAAQTEAFFAAQNDIVPITIVTNRALCDPQTLAASLHAQGVSAQHVPGLPDALVLQNPGRLDRLTAFTEGLFFVQDAASQLAVLAADLQPGERVLDLCAAPGGKSFYSAQQVGVTGHVQSFDVAAYKIDAMEKSKKRLRHDNMTLAVQDACVLQPQLKDSADVVLCDLPCSGLGIVRKKPDIRYKDLAQQAHLPALQQSILRNAAQYVKPGGRLIYSTCTLLPEENENNVAQFLQDFPAFHLEPFSLDFEGVDAPEGMLTLYPHIHGTDGFFISKLRRRV